MSNNNIDRQSRLSNSNSVTTEKSLNLSEIQSNLELNRDSTQLELATLDRAESKVWQGIKLEQDDKLDEAIQCYRQAIELNSRSAVAHHILAIALKKQNNLTEANYYHNLALSLGGENSVDNLVESTMSRHDSTALTVEGGEPLTIGSLPEHKNIENGSVNPIKSDTVVLPKLTAVAPGTYVENNQLEVTKIYLQQAKLFYAASRWQESINACEEALNVCVDLPEIYKIYGNSLQRLGKIPEAMGYYAKALTKDPYIAEVYASIGSLYAKQNDWQEAISYYQKALNIDPQQAKIHLHLSKAWERIGEDDRALDALFNALNLQPDILNQAQYLQLSEDLLAENKLELAIACCEYGIKLQPPAKGIYFKLIEILERDGQLAKATSYRQRLANLPEPNLQQTRKLKIQSLLGNASAAKYLPAGNEPRQKALKPSAVSVETRAERDNENATLAEYLEQLKQHPNSASLRLKLGNLFARQQKWHEAAANYQQAIKIEPKNAIAYLKLGKICGILGKHLDGGELIYRAYSIDPEIATAEEHFKLGEFWLKHNKGKIAMSCYRRAVQLKSGFAAAYSRLKQLIALERQQSLESDAIETVDDSIQANTASDSQTEITQDLVYCQQATAAIKAQDWQLATRCYQQAIEVNPQQPSYYYYLGRVQLKLEQWQTALKCFQNAAELDSDNADIQHNLGDAWSRGKSWSNAVTAYQKAIAIGTDNSWTYHNLGYALLQLEQWQSAADNFQRAIALKADFVWSHYNLGEALFHLEQWDDALTAYRAALQIEPGLSEAKAKVGDLLCKQSQRSQQTALSFCQEQIERDPDNVELYHQAIALDKKNLELYLGLGRALAKQGRKDEAISIYQVGLQIQPQHPELIAELNALKSAKITIPSSSNLIAKLSHTVDCDRAGDFEPLELPNHSSPTVSIIIPVYNQIEYTYKCLRSLAEHLPIDLKTEVVVVNDCSTDDTVSVLDRVSGLKRIDNSENVGFVRACNLGIKAAVGEYIYFLNNDTQLRPQALEHLLAVFERDSEVGAVGSKLIYPEGSLQEAGGIVFQDASAWNYGNKENPNAPQYNYLRQVDYCSGASLLVKKSVLEALGGFDPNFAPAYYEDTDLCLAIRHQLGFKVVYQPKSVVIHHQGVSCGVELTSPIKSYQSINQTKLAQKWAKDLVSYPADNSKLGIASASRRHSGSKTILVIDEGVPGDRILGVRRTGELLQLFKQLDHHVIFVPDRFVEDRSYVEMLQDSSIEVVYGDSESNLTIEQQLEELLPIVDLAWVCRPHLYEKYAPLIRQQQNIKLIYDTVDLYYLRLQRQHKSEGNVIEEMRQWTRMQQRELKAAQEADLTIAISPIEERILRDRGINKLAVVPNIHRAYQGERPNFLARQGLLYIGDDNRSNDNIEKVAWMVREIMPLIWSQIPELTLTLLEFDPTDEVAALAEDSRLNIIKMTSDLTSHLLHHRIFVNPLVNDAHIKEKIGASLRLGLPVVSTTAGISGMNLVNEHDVLEANRSNEFAKQILRLYNDKELWQQLAKNGEQTIANFSPQAIGQKIQPIFESVVA